MSISLIKLLVLPLSIIRSYQMITIQLKD